MINLLPIQQKEELKEEENLKIILILGTVLITFLIVFSLLLFWVKMIIKNEIEIQKASLTEKEKIVNISFLTDLEEKIRDYNLLLANLENFYKKQKNLSIIFEKIHNSFTQGMYLKSFNFNSHQSIIYITGFSPDRKSLLEFKENLEREESFSEIVFPASNWIKANDIDFTVIFKAK